MKHLRRFNESARGSVNINELSDFVKSLGGTISNCNLPDYPDSKTYYVYVDGVKSLRELTHYLSIRGIKCDIQDEMEGSTYCVLVIDGPEDTKRFVGPNGEFKPTHQPKKGTITIHYLEELLEWLYHHDNMGNEEKMENILNIEKMIQDILNGGGGRSMVKGGITYRPTWSKRLKKDLGIE